MSNYYQYKNRKIFYSFNKIKPSIASALNLILYFLFMIFFPLMISGYYESNKVYREIFNSENPYMPDNQSFMIGLIGVTVIYTLLRVVANYRIYKNFMEKINYEIYFISFIIMSAAISTITLIPFTWRSEREYRAGLAIIYAFDTLIFAFLFSIVILIIERRQNNKKVR